MSTYTVQAARKIRDKESSYGPMQVIALNLTNGDGDPVEAEWFTKASTEIPAVGSMLEGELSDGKYGKNFKKAAPAGGFRGGSGTMDPAREARIVRQHSQTTTVRLLELLATAGVVDLQKLEGDKLRDTISRWCDWFDADAFKAGQR